MLFKVILFIGLVFELILYSNSINLNFKLLSEYNLTEDQNEQSIILLLPENTIKTKIEYINLIKTSYLNASFNCYALNIVPEEGKPISNYLKDPINYIEFEILNSAVPLNREFELSSNYAKCLVIIFKYGKGKVKVSMA
ncbi:hypothetical protein [Methanobacterium sp. ACI-7]|uniref:hypothetical protein n=1 Tax=unclassified Methanobacterium TaxID=2627676 RepID=UPI0039C12221